MEDRNEYSFESVAVPHQNKLEKELSGLMQKDDKYWRENDAKFRAAKQMATYEEFEDIVKVSLRIEIF